MTKEILDTWRELKDSNGSSMPYEFVDFFDHIMKPYYDYFLLTPNDRMEIQLTLEEALLGECHITQECTYDNISNFCHKIIFKILYENKDNPSKIKEVLKNLVK